MSTESLRGLVSDLKEAFASASAKSAIEWLEKARALNNESPDLGALLAAMEPGDVDGNRFFYKAFHAVLAQAILHDEIGMDTHLETLARHLENCSSINLISLKAQFRNYRGISSIIEYEGKNPEHLLSLYLISAPEDRPQKMLANYVDYLIDNPDCNLTWKSIDTIKSNYPDTLDMVSYNYTNHHIYKNAYFESFRPSKLKLIQALYNTPLKMMDAACRILKFQISRFVDYPQIIDSNKPIPINKEAIDDLFHVAKMALTPDTATKLSHELLEAFEIITEPHWRHEQIETVLPTINAVINDIMEAAQALPIDIQGIIAQALNTDMDGKFNGNTDYLSSAADALMNCDQAPIKRQLAENALKPLTTEQALVHFKDRPNALAAVYKLTGDPELIRHMNNRARHDSISHDLGL